mmetsp:Transcript_28728/g.72240  ORF Transcript_28728/g.72240 Transcript_28728/m.72240 type:complete len:136 (+) Transcript_28728:363-770(+)
MGGFAFVISDLVDLNNCSEPDEDAYKSWILVGILAVSFMNFALVSRLVAYSGFLAGSAFTGRSEELKEDFGDDGLEKLIPAVGTMTNRATIHFSLGLRCLFVAVPTGLWHLGAWWLFGSMFGLIGLLVVLDFAYT